MSTISPSAQILTGRRLSSERVAEIQRAKILAAAVRVLDEAGYQQSTVSLIVARARVSRSAFYELFADRDECLAAIIDQAEATVERELAQADVASLLWSERVRTTLAVILGLLDLQPAQARVCIIETLRAGPAVLERRQQVMSRLAAALDAGRLEHDCADHCTPHAAEGLVGAVFAILHARLLRGSEQPLTALAEDLAAMLVLPFAEESELSAARARARSRTQRAARALRAPRPAAVL
jgi:AcrR family transcriptional regulator